MNMPDNTRWLRELVKALNYNVASCRLEVGALVETLSEADPEFRTKYEFRLTEKRRIVSETATDDTSLPERNQSNQLEYLWKMFVKESNET